MHMLSSGGGRHGQPAKQCKVCCGVAAMALCLTWARRNAHTLRQATLALLFVVPWARAVLR